MTTLPLAVEFVGPVRNGIKRSTVRYGIREFSLGPARLASGNDHIPIMITALRYTTLEQLTEADAQTDGFASLSDLLVALRRFYPRITNADPITIVVFRTR